jgi:hypothetical protein
MFTSLLERCIYAGPHAKVEAAMRIAFVLTVVAISLSSANAQSSCNLEIPSIRPLSMCSKNLESICLCGPNGNCHWEWVCPSATAPSPTRDDTVDTMRKIEEIRLIREQAKLLREQAKLLRQQNQQQSHLGLAMASMPKPTGNAKRDQRSWKKWLAKQDPFVQAALPEWSPEAYEKVRAMAIEQAIKVRMN